MTNDIFDNTFSAEDKRLLRETIGKTLVSWASDVKHDSETEAISTGHVLLDFGSFRLLPTIQDIDSDDPITEDVQRIAILTESRWKDLLGKSKPTLYLAWNSPEMWNPPGEWHSSGIGKTITGVTLYTDVKTDWYRHDDGHLTYTHDACGIAFHFGGDATLLLEKTAAFTLNWCIRLQYSSEARLVGERDPGALVAEQL